MAEIVVVVRYLAQPGREELALSSIQDLVRTVLAREPECGGIEVLRDVDHPGRITLVERWPDQATFVGPHMQQPHIQAFIQGAGGFLGGPPEISFHGVVGVA